MNTPLAQYRASQKKSLEALAGELRVNKTTVMRWARGDFPIPVARLNDIERVTGLSKRDLRPDIFEAAE